MTGIYAALELIAVMAVVVSIVLATRARRAGAALRATEEKYRQLLEQQPTPESTSSARNQLAHQTQVIEAIGRRAGDLAHELNDLLTGIIGRTELLITNLDEAHPGMADAHEIRRGALSAARITRSLRGLTGPRAATEVIDVNAATSRTADALREMLGSNIDVSIALDPGVTRVRAGASHVEEIVVNLAMNARALMPNGGRLTLSTAKFTRHEADVRLGPAGDYVRMIVADTGVGMSEADRRALFEPLLVSQDAGSGAIGLAKVCDIVKQAGGQIHVDSAPGLGTTFTIDLPAAVELPVVPAVTALAGTAGTSVLVVEDEPRVRDLIKLVLARGGHDVMAVAGPREALTVLNRQPSIDLLLIDVVMPEMSGYDLAVQARTLVPGVRVVFMSGFARDLTRHPPEDGFLPKPFKIEALNHVVEQALKAS